MWRFSISKILFSFLILLSVVCIGGCVPADPSKYDLKSPCATSVGNANNVDGPCIRYEPELNRKYFA